METLGGGSTKEGESKYSILLSKKVEQTWKSRKKYTLSLLKKGSSMQQREKAINGYVDTLIGDPEKGAFADFVKNKKRDLWAEHIEEENKGLFTKIKKRVKKLGRDVAEDDNGLQTGEEKGAQMSQIFGKVIENSNSESRTQSVVAKKKDGVKSVLPVIKLLGMSMPKTSQKSKPSSPTAKNKQNSFTPTRRKSSFFVVTTPILRRTSLVRQDTVNMKTPKIKLIQETQKKTEDNSPDAVMKLLGSLFAPDNRKATPSHERTTKSRSQGIQPTPMTKNSSQSKNQQNKTLNVKIRLKKEPEGIIELPRSDSTLSSDSQRKQADGGTNIRNMASLIEQLMISKFAQITAEQMKNNNVQKKNENHADDLIVTAVKGKHYKLATEEFWEKLSQNNRRFKHYLNKVNNKYDLNRSAPLTPFEKFYNRISKPKDKVDLYIEQNFEPDEDQLRQDALRRRARKYRMKQPKQPLAKKRNSLDIESMYVDIKRKPNHHSSSITQENLHSTMAECYGEQAAYEALASDEIFGFMPA